MLAMDYEVIDRVLGDSLEPGDFINYDSDTYQLLGEQWDDGDNTVCWLAYNLDTGDEDAILLDPRSYYDLMGQ